MDPVEHILELLSKVKRVGTRWVALCPGHDDRSPSLSIAQGEDGRALIKCHAGCSTEQIVATLGIELKDLFPAAPRSSTRSNQTAQSLTCDGAEDVLLRGVRRSEGEGFQIAHRFDYDVVGGGKLRVLRFEDGRGRKTFRQMSSAGGSWLLRGPDAPTLPYRHAHLPDIGRVAVVEGELCVDELMALGVPATTSAGGSGAAKKTCWDCLDGKELALFPDNDRSGGDYMRKVRELAHPRSAVIVELPELGEGGDVVDFIAAQRAAGQTDQAIREELLRSASDVEQPELASVRSDRARFPLEALPNVVTDFVRAVGRSRCVEVPVAASFAIAAMGSAIGLARVAYDSFADWEEIPVFWLALVARSGTRKSVVVEDLFGPLLARQLRLMEEFEAAREAYEQELANWKKREKKNKTNEAEPKPDVPDLEHVHTTDTTPEGLIDILRIADRGIVVLTDELTSFFGSMGRYAGKADSDRGFYLALFRGVHFKLDRKTAGPVLIPKAAASIVGGIQPGILATSFSDAAFQSGLASRFLLVMPSPQVKEYLQGPTLIEKRAYADFIDALFELKMEPYSGAEGAVGRRPQRVEFTDDARELLAVFVPDWSEEALLSSANVEAAMSKLEGYAIRFALVLRVCREVTGDAQPDDPITRQDLEHGIQLARWFRDEALRVYEVLGEESAGAGQTELLARVAIIRKRFDGAVTAREWRQRNTRHTTDQARAELDELVKAGLAEWRKRDPGRRGGKPTQECALLDDDPNGGSSSSPEEVSGCGLRGTEPDYADRNLRRGVENGDEEVGSQGRRNPEPVDDSPATRSPLPPKDTTAPCSLVSNGGGAADDEAKGQQRREAELGRWSQAVPAPRNPQLDTPSSHASLGQNEERVLGRNRERQDGLITHPGSDAEQEDSAPRNPQPGTPTAGSGEGARVQVPEVVQPRTPVGGAAVVSAEPCDRELGAAADERFLHLVLETFDGTEVEPCEAVPVSQLLDPDLRWLHRGAKPERERGRPQTGPRAGEQLGIEWRRDDHG